MGTVEQDLAAHERRIDKEDRIEALREQAIAAEVARLMQLPLAAIVDEVGLSLLGIDMESVVSDIAAAIVARRKPDDGDPVNRPAPRYWEGL